IVGLLWLVVGLLQLQPQMFTINLVDGIMKPTVEGQPAAVAASLNWIIAVTSNHLVLVNLLIAFVQIGLGLLLLTGIRIRVTVIASCIWALVVWYGGEGMNMLLTGQASVLTGAPGAVLFYPLLGLLIYPRARETDTGVIGRSMMRWFLAGFWFLAALLQLQPYWWGAGHISQTLGSLVGLGGLNGLLVDPILQGFANVTSHAEISINMLLIVVFLGLGAALSLVKEEQLRPVLMASIVVSLGLWWGVQGFGMIFTGTATDFNSGLLLIIMALACWSRVQIVRTIGSPAEAKKILVESSSI
ncbi:MAG TPA: hypothetical protein VFN02_11185, partial [Ktedonobacteraceae bacterium]|nr:hypothetical protein [Ktedonobacteraceae bacterium]